ncbi:P-loop containing nucleoside triphosphate hydrolase protein [Dissophora ornata]|nr:P-loop containing nucleoside triphosphate hydrolase protein [Dissophora ornata]
MTQLTNAIVKTKYAGQYVISQGVRALPFEFNTDSSKGYFLNQMSAYLFPFGLSFLLPTFVSILVQEKEDRHRMMMAMNGLRPVSYYLAHYVEFFTMQMILSLFFCLTCVAISSQFILRTDPSIIIVLLIIWSHVQTTMSFLIATLFSKTRRATLIVYFFVAITCIMSSIASQIFKDGKPFAWYIHPSFSFFNILYVGILHSSRVNGLYPLTWSDFAAGTVLFKCLILMIGESILFLLLTFYIDAVAPSEYGVQKPWYFPITSLFRRRSSSRHHASLSSTPYAHGSEDILEDADTDVYAERDRVQNQYDPVKTPLIIQNLFHRYRGKVEPALKGLSFGVETNTVLGLLGPNGAGKSTLIHLLTGLYSPTSGTACVAGANIRTDMSTVHAKIGVCPQHDILWGDLTVADHMLFYARMRGIPPALEQQAVTYAIASVSLTKFRDRQIKGLSGGEKRRVSIAIALLGDNSVIFLDEPSTGLDPAVRRIIWDIINRVKVNKTVVLTTHSMEEADILSDRIAIMTLGRLRCIGTSLHLKELYGSGFRLNISSKPGKLQEACESVEKQILKGFNFRRIDKFTNATTYEFDPQQQDRQGQTASTGQLSRVFSCLSQAGMFPAIEDWGLSQTTLEDVFIKIVTEGDSAIALPAIVSP